MSKLELRRDAGGLRHYLDGKPVEAGAALETLTLWGWRACRYEWSFVEGEAPRLYMDGMEFPVAHDDMLRWPQPQKKAMKNKHNSFT